jgi:hypothetical protein
MAVDFGTGKGGGQVTPSTNLPIIGQPSRSTRRFSRDPQRVLAMLFMLGVTVYW